MSKLTRALFDRMLKYEAEAERTVVIEGGRALLLALLRARLPPGWQLTVLPLNGWQWLTLRGVRIYT